MTHRHDHLDHARDTRCRLRVPDVGLQRSQPQRSPVLGPLLPVRGQQCLRLDRVAQRRARAVRLHHVHVRTGQTGPRQRRADDALLRRSVRCGEPVAGTVLVDGRTPYHRQHPVPVAARVRQTLHQQHAHTFAPAGAVRVVREGLHPAVRGQPALTGELREHRAGGHHGDAADEGGRAFVVAQCLDGHVEGDQRGRARRVHRHRRPLQAQHVRHPSREHGGGRAGHEVALGAFRRLDDVAAVALRGGADVDAGAAALHRQRVDAGPLEDLPGRLQQQPLLRVHGQGLTRVDAEERGVEVAGSGEPAGRDGQAVLGGVARPSPVGGDVADGVHALGDDPPQFVRRAHAPGEPAAHADDDHRVVVGRGGTGDRAGDRGPCRAAVGRLSEDERQEVVGEVRDGGVVEDQGGGEAQTAERAEPVADVHGREGVEAEFPEGACGIEFGGVRVTEDGGGLPADQVEDAVALLGRGEPGEALLQRGGDGGLAARLGLGGVQDLPHLGQVLEQRTAARDGERGDEAVPADVGDGERRLVPRDGLPQRVDVEVGVHDGQTAAAEQLLRLSLGHAGTAPGTPGQGGRGAATGPAGGGERVQVGVGRGVGALAATAPDAGDGGEHDEGVERVVAEDVVQVAGAGDLGRDHVGEGGVVGVLDGAELADAGRVDHGGDGVPLLPQSVDEGPHGGAVGDVAGGDRDAHPQGGQLRPEFGRARRGGSASAGQDQVLGPQLGEPAGQEGTEGAGAARDEDGAPRGPALGRPSHRGAQQAPGVHTGGPDGHLVLAVVTAGRPEDGAHPGQGTVVQDRGEVDLPAPTSRVLESDDPSETGDHGLVGCGERVRPADGDGPAGERPQRGGARGGHERLHQVDGGDEPGGQRREVGVRGLVETEEGQDALDVLGVVESGERAEGERFRLGAVPDETGDEGVGQGGRPGGRIVRYDDQPAPGRGGGRLTGRGHGLPGDVVAPGVDRRAFLAVAPPRADDGQGRVQRPGVGPAEGRGQGFRVALLDGLPEARLVGVHGPRGPRYGGTGLGVRPVALPLERVGGQWGGAGTGAGEDGGPVDRDAVAVGLGEGGQEALRAALVTAEGTEDGGVLDGSLEAHRQDGMRADLDEHLVPVGEGGAGGVLELDGVAEVVVPVAAVHRRLVAVEETARQGRVQGRAALLRGDAGQQTGQLLPDGLDVGGVGRVVHVHPAGPDPGRLAGRDQLVEGVDVTRHHRGRGTVHRGDGYPPVPRRDRLAHRVRRLSDGHHAAETGERGDGA